MKLYPAIKKTRPKNPNDPTFTVVRTGANVKTYQGTSKGLSSFSDRTYPTVSAAKQAMQDA